jgi:low temperature requirement protein LtrA
VALGESIVGTGAPAAVARNLGNGELFAVVAAFTISCSLWWAYFAHANEAMRHALTMAEARGSILRRVFSYAHLVLVASVIAIAVGFHVTVAEPDRHLDTGTVALLYGGTALYLLTFGYTRWTMFRLPAQSRLIAAGVLVVLAPVMPRVPALAALVVLAVLLVGLNGVEEARIRRVRAAAGPAPEDVVELPELVE